MTNNILYSRTLVGARESSDGETATMLRVCAENNGTALYFSSADHYAIIGWSAFSPYLVIERAVQISLKEATEIAEQSADLLDLNTYKRSQSL